MRDKPLKSACRNTLVVIPGPSKASLGSGFALRAPRNDGGQAQGMAQTEDRLIS